MVVKPGSPQRSYQVKSHIFLIKMYSRKLRLSIFHVCMLHLFGISCYISVLGSDGALPASAALSVNIDDGNNDDTKPQENYEFDQESGDGDADIFQPTNEWQVIKPGQSIPRGLHVRMDFQTGIKEAKLLDPEDVQTDEINQVKVVADGEDTHVERVNSDGEVEESVDMEDEKMKYWKDGDHEGMRMINKDHFTQTELKEALKKFKSGMDDVKDKEEAKKLQEKYRSYSELKKDFEAMNVMVETDTEIMQRLVEQYKQKDASLQQRVNVLLELEYYVHQIDNAQNLESVGGFQILVDGLNDTELQIKEACAFVLGSAFQSNPKVQIQGLKEGAMSSLLRLMYNDQPMSVQKKALYAVSSLIRHFPHAQLKFVSHGGVVILSQLLQRETIDMLPIQIRAITLLNDLVNEHKSAQNTYDNDSSDSVAKQRLEQYKKVNISKLIEEHGCLVVRPLYSSDHDVREKVLLAMKNLLVPCESHFKSQNLIDHLSEMKIEYEVLVKDELLEGETDGFFGSMLILVDTVLSQLT
ncbi:nucleotide exchange factor SIL1-like [Anneissia japonica]|uniref:nucleotide exchange factor SIL1-like n=1 Tax=Anneissia japonica TaxID=1529436 RepID=UPI001425961C|nr:nucleotide exchange factor SIL1-like [Anneissia japonica]